MNRINKDGLDDIFDLDTPVVESKEITKPIQDTSSDDMEVVKKVHRNLIEKSQDALDVLIEFAKASESPRAFEIVSELIRTTSDVAKNLADITYREKKNSQVETINNTQNNMFLTTTADLQKLLKGNKDA